jgi:hypothetical protein
MSTSGAGVASILIDEASYLNPAPLAFYNKTSFYYQSYGQKIEDISGARSGEFAQMTEINGDSVTISDTKNSYKGALSYQGYRFNKIRRARFVASFARAATKNSSIGFSIRRTKDVHDNGDEKTYNQGVIGTSHVISKNLTAGAVIIDPLGKIKSETRAIVGLQYIFSEVFMTMFDFGGNFKETFSDTFITRLGLQINFYKQIYVRMGFYSDKANNTKGDSYGISWIGPKISMDYAIKKSSILDDSKAATLAFADERIIEHSLSFSLRF